MTKQASEVTEAPDPPARAVPLPRKHRSGSAAAPGDAAQPSLLPLLGRSLKSIKRLKAAVSRRLSGKSGRATERPEAPAAPTPEQYRPAAASSASRGESTMLLSTTDVASAEHKSASKEHSGNLSGPALPAGPQPATPCRREESPKGVTIVLPGNAPRTSDARILNRQHTPHARLRAPGAVPATASRLQSSSPASAALADEEPPANDTGQQLPPPPAGEEGLAGEPQPNVAHLRLAGCRRARIAATASPCTRSAALLNRQATPYYRGREPDIAGCEPAADVEEEAAVQEAAPAGVMAGGSAAGASALHAGSYQSTPAGSMAGLGSAAPSEDGRAGEGTLRLSPEYRQLRLALADEGVPIYTAPRPPGAAAIKLQPAEVNSGANTPSRKGRRHQITADEGGALWEQIVRRQPDWSAPTAVYKPGHQDREGGDHGDRSPTRKLQRTLSGGAGLTLLGGERELPSMHMWSRDSSVASYAPEAPVPAPEAPALLGHPAATAAEPPRINVRAMRSPRHAAGVPGGRIMRHLERRPGMTGSPAGSLMGMSDAGGGGAARPGSAGSSDLLHLHMGFKPMPVPVSLSSRASSTASRRRQPEPTWTAAARGSRSSDGRSCIPGLAAGHLQHSAAIRPLQRSGLSRPASTNGHGALSRLASTNSRRPAAPSSLAPTPPHACRRMLLPSASLRSVGSACDGSGEHIVRVSDFGIDSDRASDIVGNVENSAMMLSMGGSNVMRVSMGGIVIEGLIEAGATHDENIPTPPHVSGGKASLDGRPPSVGSGLRPRNVLAYNDLLRASFTTGGPSRLARVTSMPRQQHQAVTGVTGATAVSPVDFKGPDSGQAGGAFPGMRRLERTGTVGSADMRSYVVGEV